MPLRSQRFGGPLLLAWRNPHDRDSGRQAPKRSSRDRDLTAGRLRKRMQQATLGVEVAPRQELGVYREMPEAVDLLRVGSTLRGIDGQVVQVRATATG